MSATLHKTFVFRLKPTAGQERALQHYLDVTREVYNAALNIEHRAWAAPVVEEA